MFYLFFCARVTLNRLEILCIVQETKKQAPGDVYSHSESKHMVNKRRKTKENQLKLHTAQHVRSQLTGGKNKYGKTKQLYFKELKN